MVCSKYFWACGKDDLIYLSAYYLNFEKMSKLQNMVEK